MSILLCLFDSVIPVTNVAELPVEETAVVSLSELLLWASFLIMTFLMKIILCPAGLPEFMWVRRQLLRKLLGVSLQFGPIFSGRFPWMFSYVTINPLVDMALGLY